VDRARTDRYVEVDFDPLTYWLENPEFTYKLRLCEERNAARVSFLHLKPDGKIVVTWNGGSTEPHGQWMRTEDARLWLQYNAWGPCNPGRHLEEYILLEGTSVYKGTGDESGNYLMPATDAERQGPLWPETTRIETSESDMSS